MQCCECKNQFGWIGAWVGSDSAVIAKTSEKVALTWKMKLHQIAQFVLILCELDCAVQNSRICQSCFSGKHHTLSEKDLFECLKAAQFHLALSESPLRGNWPHYRRQECHQPTYKSITIQKYQHLP